MPEYIVDVPSPISFQALDRYDGSNMGGARISIKRLSDGQWWNGSDWDLDIDYINMDYIGFGAHEYNMTFSESGNYLLLFTNLDESMISDNYVVPVYSESRMVISDIVNASLRGSGAKAAAVTAKINDIPVADADVWVTTDPDGLNVVAGTLQTDSLGNVVFNLDDNVTYYIWIQKDGYNFNNPAEVIW